MDLSYILNHLGEDRAAYFNAVAPAVVQSSNFAFSDLADMRNKFSDELSNHVYSRGNNPTVEILRKKIAALEHAEDCLVFSSGAAAIAIAVIANVKSGDHIVCVKSPYSWTANLLKKFLSRFNISHTFVDGKSISEIEVAMQENTTVLFLESPNTLFFEIQDLRACALLAKEKGITTIIDNSHCSPIFQKPLEFGIDIVVHSGTKYINGHSDVVVGLLCSSNEMIQKIFQSEFMTLGAILSPHDANLVIRGLRTLELRVKKSDSSAAKIAEWLYQQKQVEKIFFPFHPSFEQYELAKSQMSGCGGLITVQFKTDSMSKMENFIHALEHFLIAVSWGGHESLMMPTIGFYNIKGRDANPPIPWNTVRFYIGLEDPDWLLKDLENAMKFL